MSSFNYIFPKTIYGRDAIKLVQNISEIKGNIIFENEKEDRSCNAKSLLGVLSLGIEKGENIKICIDSDNSEEIFNIIKGIIESE